MARKELFRDRRKAVRRNRILSGLLALLLLLGGGYGLYWLQNNQKTPLPMETPVETGAQTPAETPAETPIPETPESPGEVPAPETPEKPETPETSPEGGPDLPPPVDEDQLKTGTNHSLRASAYAYKTQDVRNWMKGYVPYTGEKIAFLTFDDGPTKITAPVLDILKALHVPATFFIPGITLERFPDQAILERYIREGHALGTHSYSHDYKVLYPNKVADPDRIVQEYQKTLALMKSLLGDGFETKVFRFPGGSGSWKNITPAREKLLHLGVVDMDWNSISGDAEPASRRPGDTAATVQYVMDTLMNNREPDVAVVLMHDSKSVTPEYLQAVIQRLQAEGYHFGILE